MAVPVQDKDSKPLQPCTEKRARLLLKKGRAEVVGTDPFIIKLHDRTQEDYLTPKISEVTQCLR